MGRPKGDKYWNQVTIEENGKWKCKHCNLTFSGGFSRIKAHVDQTKGKGIAICSVASGNDRVPNTSNSSNPQEAVNTLNALQGWVAEHDVNGNNNVNGTFQIEINDLNQLVSDLTRQEDEIKGQLQWLESRGKKRKSNVDTWLNQLHDLKKRVVDMADELQPRNRKETQQLTEEMRKHKELKPLVLTNECVGDDFEANVYKMWDLLEDEQVFIIGIHGMGGVGKTFLATYMENEIKRNGTLKDVFWVTVSHDFTIFKLQHQIAETVGVRLFGDDERTRATILSSALETREKFVLILDDVWEYIDIQKVGIPLRVNGIKLIMTSRLKHVCRQMDCLPHSTITMYPLPWEEEEEEEAWELFLLKLGHHGTPATLPPEVLEIARSMARRCEGLPLGINVMARTMKGENDIHWWRHALNKLDKMEMGKEVKEEVLTALKRSYDNLIEKDMQKCFLYCVLSLPDYIERGDLVMKLVESGLLNGKMSLGEIFDEGHVVVAKLINHSLLLDEEDDIIGLHGLVRNMVCHILNDSHTYMVKCDQGLRKIPHVREWTVDLEAVSLMKNMIEKIPEGISPNCARLSTLILSDNCISHIPECFFTHMNALAVLDLSYNRRLTSLPNSLSNMTSLTSLVLKGCLKLSDLPPLGELQALSRLDISGCSILQVPEGMQNLMNMKWLDLSWNENLTLVPGCVLPGLTNMQYLDLRRCSSIKVEDVQGMSILECFAGSFLDWYNYDLYMRNIQESGYGPDTYLIHFGKLEYWTAYFDVRPIYSEFRRRSVWFGDCEELPYLLPKDLAKLSVSDNNQWECLCSALSSNGPSSLKNIDIGKCTKLKSLFCLSCSACTNIQNLESLKLYCLESLTAICKDVADLTQSLSPMGVFSHLMYFHIDGCHGIETLLTPRLVPQLQNLKSITVGRSNSLKEIFAESNSVDDESFNITLPKLTTLKLYLLPQLKTVCKGILNCVSEDILDIAGCPNLERFPTIRRLV